MKTLIQAIALLVMSIAANGYLSALHYTKYQQYYEQCKTELIAQNNYKTNDQAFQCVSSKPAMKVLGTLLFKEGSLLEK